MITHQNCQNVVEAAGFYSLAVTGFVSPFSVWNIKFHVLSGRLTQPMLGRSLKNLTSCLHMTSRMLFVSWWSLFILVWYYDPICDIRNETAYYNELHQLSSDGDTSPSCQSPLVTENILAMVNLRNWSKGNPTPMF